MLIRCNQVLSVTYEMDYVACFSVAVVEQMNRVTFQQSLPSSERFYFIMACQWMTVLSQS